MAKVFIEETTLTAIGDAIREKEGTTELVPVNDMATRISAIETGGGGAGVPEEALSLTGNLNYRFAAGGWDWFINQYGNKISSTNITSLSYAFSKATSIVRVPFTLNVKDIYDFSYCFDSCNSLMESPKIRGNIKFSTTTNMTDMLASCYKVRDFENLFEAGMLTGFSTVTTTGAYNFARLPTFKNCFSLRAIPSWWYECKLNTGISVFPYYSYTPYYYGFNACYVLDEARNIPVWKCAAAQTSNMFNSTLSYAHRLKSFTFETNDGQPIETQWKAQTIDLTERIGFSNTSDTYRILDYNSGITNSTRVTDDASYQALKNDPDWWAANWDYSRYNHDSAVETINSLPDTSAYLASAGGTNTIKFTGNAGSKTDGGAINTLTAEEIAVAAAKGWTVTLV